MSNIFFMYHKTSLESLHICFRNHADDSVCVSHKSVSDSIPVLPQCRLQLNTHISKGEHFKSHLGHRYYKNHSDRFISENKCSLIMTRLSDTGYAHAPCSVPMSACKKIDCVNRRLTHQTHFSCQEQRAV